MTSIYLSPLLAGSRARSCGRAGGGREEEQGQREGSTEARLQGGEGAPGGPAAPPPPTVPHTQRPPLHAAPHTQIGSYTPPGAEARARAEHGSQRPPARAVGEGVPEPSSSRSQVPDTSASPPPAALPATPVARGLPGRGRRPGSVSRYLHEGLYRAFGRVQVGGAQMAALVHRGRRVYQEQ